jgi:DNA-directed RNA polymerase I, II, and III subunit RPABC2
MSDVEYSASGSGSDSDSETDMELKSKTRKQGKIAAKKTNKLAKPGSDDEEDDNSSAVGSDSDADESVADSKDDSDIEDDINPEDMNEDDLFKDVVKPSTGNQEDDEFQFGFDSGNDEDSDLDDDDDGTQYLQKLDESVREQTIANHHPELIIHNYDEVEALTTVIRDERGVIIDPLHRTLPFLSKYERTRILGERAKQINDGAKPFVVSDISIIDGYLIALKELEEKKLPFIIRRPLNNGASEYWKLRDLEFL